MESKKQLLLVSVGPETLWGFIPTRTLKQTLHPVC